MSRAARTARAMRRVHSPLFRLSLCLASSQFDDRLPWIGRLPWVGR